MSSAFSVLLSRFHAGEADFLLASELASRGLDIAGVEVVINFNVPQDIDRSVTSNHRDDLASFEA